MKELQTTLAAAHELVGHDLPRYSEIVRRAFSDAEPLFMRARYSQFFWHCASTVPAWLPKVVLANAQTESDGAHKLLSLWERLDWAAGVEAKILFHARDEARHSRVFVRLAEATFPGIFDADDLSRFAETLTTIEPSALTKTRQAIDRETLADHLVQMNMGEIRTRLHVELFAPVLRALAPRDSQEAVTRMLERLAADEIVHIGYIARILEDMAEDGDTELLQRLYTARLKDFHRLTVEQTEAAVQAYGDGRFPDLLDF